MQIAKANFKEKMHKFTFMSSPIIFLGASILWRLLIYLYFSSITDTNVFFYVS